jgi:hypothetical protein
LPPRPRRGPKKKAADIRWQNAPRHCARISVAIRIRGRLKSRFLREAGLFHEQPDTAEQNEPTHKPSEAMISGRSGPGAGTRRRFNWGPPRLGQPDREIQGSQQTLRWLVPRQPKNRHTKRRALPPRNRWFESCSLQRRVQCEPNFRGRIPSMTVRPQLAG